MPLKICPAQEYIDNIAENVAFMGWRPARTTFSSDYFPQLFDLAVELIKRGKAFVCHQTPEETAESRNRARSKLGMKFFFEALLCEYIKTIISQSE